MREIFGHSAGSVLRGIGLRMAENGGSYLFNSLAVAYATGTVMVSKSIGPIAVAVASLIGIFTVPLAGWVSDRVGRVPVYRVGAAVLLLLAFPGWYLISLGQPWLVIVVISVAIGFGVNTMLGSQCAMLPELFGNRHRYLGVAVSREFSAVIAGGLAGVLGAYLIKVYNGSWLPLAIYTFVLAAITFATTFVTPETLQRDLTRIPDALDDARAGARTVSELASESLAQRGSAMRLFDLAGRSALVTGSSRGIGLALAEGLLEAGARVVVHGRDVETAKASAARLEQATGGETMVSTFDLTDPAAVDAGVAGIEQHWGTPDILVNNAGIQRRTPFVDFSYADWNDLVATNLTSAFLVGQRVARGMVERGSGKIINIGSVQSRLARPGIAPYSATKGGIVMLTKGMCADLGPYGIQANAVAPGYFATELTKALVEDESFTAWVTGRTPAGRWGEVTDLVGGLVFLASSASDFVNGQVLYIDGGMTAVV
jgi:gluconate 5-dehydrogenase